MIFNAKLLFSIALLVFSSYQKVFSETKEETGTKLHVVNYVAWGGDDCKKGVGCRSLIAIIKTKKGFRTYSSAGVEYSGYPGFLGDNLSLKEGEIIFGSPYTRLTDRKFIFNVSLNQLMKSIKQWRRKKVYIEFDLKEFKKYGITYENLFPKDNKKNEFKPEPKYNLDYDFNITRRKQAKNNYTPSVRQSIKKETTKIGDHGTRWALIREALYGENSKIRQDALKKLLNMKETSEFISLKNMSKQSKSVRIYIDACRKINKEYMERTCLGFWDQFRQISDPIIQKHLGNIEGFKISLFGTSQEYSHQFGKQQGYSAGFMTGESLHVSVKFKLRKKNILYQRGTEFPTETTDIGKMPGVTLDRYSTGSGYDCSFDVNRSTESSFIREILSRTSRKSLEDIALNSDFCDLRLAAVSRLTPRFIYDNEKQLADEELLTKVSEEDRDENVRVEALKQRAKTIIERISRMSPEKDNVVLSKMAQNDKDDEVRGKAAAKLHNETVLSAIVLHDENPAVRNAAIKNLSKGEVLKKVALTDSEPYIRAAALRKLKYKGILNELVIKNTSPIALAEAIMHSSDTNALTKLMNNSTDPRLRRYALWRFLTILTINKTQKPE